MRVFAKQVTVAARSPGHRKHDRYVRGSSLGFRQEPRGNPPPPPPPPPPYLHPLSVIFDNFRHRVHDPPPPPPPPSPPPAAHKRPNRAVTDVDPLTCEVDGSRVLAEVSHCWRLQQLTRVITDERHLVRVTARRVVVNDSVRRYIRTLQQPTHTTTHSYNQHTPTTTHSYNNTLL